MTPQDRLRQITAENVAAGGAIYAHLLAEVDLTTCPACGTTGDHWLQEIAKRTTWQPVSLRNSDAGGVEIDDYQEFDYGDDVEVTHWECRECMWSWESLDQLATDLLAAQNAREDEKALELTGNVSLRAPGEDTGGALAVMVINPKIRAFLEANDPEAVAQARVALGLALPDEAVES